MSATDWFVCGILGGIMLAAVWLMLAVAHDAWTNR